MARFFGVPMRNGVALGVASTLPMRGGLPVPALNLDFLSGALDSRITFTRGSTATFFDSTGTLQSAAINAARFDHNPSTLAPLGLLIEEQRQNLLLQSGWAGATSGTPGAAPTSWTIGFGTNTVTTVLTSNFDPTANAVKFDCDSGERVMFQQAINVTNGVQYALSAYLEAVSGAIGDGLFVVAGTATVTQNTFVTSPSTPGRYTILFTATGTGTVTVRVGVGTSATVGATVSATWSHPQVEAGAFATSYIPTTTTALTRNADVASMTGTNFSSWFNPTASTLYAEWTNIAAAIPSGGSQVICEISDGTTSNFYRVFQSQVVGTKASTNMFSGGVNPGRLDSGGAYSNATVKAASAFAASDRAISANGNAATTSATGALPINVNRMNIGAEAALTNFINGTIRRVSYYPRRLPDSTLQALTA